METYANFLNYASPVQVKMNIFLIAIGAGATIAIITAISFLTIPDNRPHCNSCPMIPSPDQPLQITNMTIDPQNISIGSSFTMYADVYNPNPYSVYVEEACESPLSATFDKNVKTVDNNSCLTISKREIPSGQHTRIFGPKSGRVYTATDAGNVTATITVTYEAKGNVLTTTIDKKIMITSQNPLTPSQTIAQLKLARTDLNPVDRNPTELRLDCNNPIGSQMKSIDESIDVQKAIHLAYTSPDFISKVNQYGTVTYSSFFNDWVTGDPCNTMWKGVEVVFTATLDNGTARNIQVSEDINLSKVLNVTEYQAGFSRG